MPRLGRSGRIRRRGVAAARAPAATVRNSQVYTADGRPEFGKDSRSHGFRRLDGKMVILNQKDVREIKQEDQGRASCITLCQ